jgi:hypothetical protein
MFAVTVISIVLILLLTGLGYFVGKSEVKNEAIEAGVAKYVLTDPTKSDTKFQWITKTNITTITNVN